MAAGLDAGLDPTHGPAAIMGKSIGEAAEFFNRTNITREEQDLRRSGQQFSQSLQTKQEARAQENFDMSKQLHPYKLKEAQMEVDTKRLKYEEAERKAADDAEAGRLYQDFVESCGNGKCTAEDMTLKALNLSWKSRNERGVAAAMSDLKAMQTDREFAEANNTLLTETGPLFSKAMKSGDIEDWEAWERAANDPKHVKARKGNFYQGGVKQAEEKRRNVMTDPAREAISTFRATMADSGNTRPADEVWNEILSKDEKAAEFFASNDKRVPLEVTKSIGTRAKKEERAGKLEEIRATGEETRKTEAVKQEGRMAVTAQRGKASLADLKSEATALTRELTSKRAQLKNTHDEEDNAALQAEIADLEAQLTDNRKLQRERAVGTEAAGKGVDQPTVSRVRSSLDRRVKTFAEAQRAVQILRENNKINEATAQHLLNWYRRKLPASAAPAPQ